MRSFASLFAASAILAGVVLSSMAASAQPADEPAVACAARSDVAPATLVESCTALIEDSATSDADRLDAVITRAVALHNSGQTDKALAELDAAIARDQGLARAFRARGEILRQSGKSVAALDR
jgi:Tfp pilus assembly protein PilF